LSTFDLLHWLRSRGALRGGRIRVRGVRVQWRRRLVHLFLEPFQGLAQSFADLRQAPGPEDDQDNRQDDDELREP
jgi:hypothetical protein